MLYTIVLAFDTVIDRELKDQSAILFTVSFSHPGWGVTSLYGFFGDVPLDRVWFLALLSYTGYTIFLCVCPKQGVHVSFVLNMDLK